MVPPTDPVHGRGPADLDRILLFPESGCATRMLVCVLCKRGSIELALLVLSDGD